MNGGTGGATVWKGTAFSNCDNEITLLHRRFENGTFEECNNGAITGRSIRVKNNNCSNGEDCLYVSQLEIIINSEMLGKNIKCLYDNGMISTPIDSIVLTFVTCTNTLENLNNHNNVTLKGIHS